jgi:type II secretory pathway pseudopilin PulG
VEKKVIRMGAQVGLLPRQRGASLLEGIAYLGIAALIILGAVSLLTTAFGNAQSNRALEEVISLRTSVRKLYSGQNYATGNIATTVIAANAVPGTLITNRTANTITNAWGGDVALTGAGTNFTITYNNVPQDVCISMISGANGWRQIDRGGNDPITVFPATAANAQVTCASGSNAYTFTAS